MVRRHTTYIFLLLMVLTFGSLDRVVAQIHDADGQYVDTVFHDHIDRTADDFVRAYYVVAQQGGALYSIFGHACLHLVCPSFGLDYYFSYESEDATQKVFKFLSGNLKMGMLALTPEEYLCAYRNEGRGVTEYEMLLPIEVKRELWRILDEHVQEGIYLPYDYEKRGCAYACTRMLNAALGDKRIVYAPWQDKFYRTRREMCYDKGHTCFPWSTAFLMALVGSDGDKELSPSEKLIIPSELAEVWQTAKVDGKPIISSTPSIVVPFTIEYKKPWFTPTLLACLLFILTLVGWVLNKPYVDWLVLAIVTCIGAFVMYLVLISTLPCTEWNWLIIPFNILPALCWRWRRYWALPYAAVCLLWLMAMIVSRHRLVDPAFLFLVTAEIVVFAKQWQQCTIVKSRRLKSVR